MNDSRVAGKVGLFVALALGLMAALVLLFSKGLSPFSQTYRLQLRAKNVGGLKARSSVQIAGVEVGRVVGANLAAQGQGVLITVEIDRRYPIYSDARFLIEQIGFLGDQFVAVYPTANQGHLLQHGEEVVCDEPFNLQQVARTAVGFIERVDETARTLNTAMTRVNTILLTEETLTNFALAAADFRRLCGRGLETMDRLNWIVRTNADPVTLAASNLVDFSAGLKDLAADLRSFVADHRAELTNTVAHLEAASMSVATLARDLESGRGVGGALLKDEPAREHLTNSLANFSVLSGNLVVLTSNLNRYGLLYKPKQPKTSSVTKPSYPGRSPFN